MKTVYDLLVIGAGPAGGSCAEKAAELGLKVLVLEEDSRVGEPLHCGECISKVAMDKLGDIPEEVIAEYATGVRVIFPGPRSNLCDEPGAVLHKEKFEQWIVEKAKSKGAKVHLEEKFESAENRLGIWEVKTNKAIYKAKIIIDGSGVKSVLSQKLGLNERSKSVVGIQHLMECNEFDGYLDFYVWPEFAPHGYLWMISKGNGLANVGLVTTESNKAKEYLEKFLAEKGWQNNKIIKTFGGLIPASGPVENTCGDGWILIGDAAGFTSPLFEGGTHLGIQSGLFAAQVAKKAIEQKNTKKEVLSEYELLWKKEFPDYKMLVGGKDAIYALTDEQLKDVSELMPKQLGTLNSADKLKVLYRMIFVKPHISKKKLFKVFNAFKYSRARNYGW